MDWDAGLSPRHDPISNHTLTDLEKIKEKLLILMVGPIIIEGNTNVYACIKRLTVKKIIIMILTNSYHFLLFAHQLEGVLSKHQGFYH